MWPPDTSDRRNEQYLESNLDMGKLKVSKDHNLVKAIVDGLAATKMINLSLGLALQLNSVRRDIQDVLLSYET